MCSCVHPQQQEQRKAQEEEQKRENELRIAEMAKRAPATNYNAHYAYLFNKVPAKCLDYMLTLREQNIAPRLLTPVLPYGADL